MSAMSNPIKIGSRGSRLALTQVQEILGLLPFLGTTELKVYSTAGDRDKTTSLTSNPADDFFTNTLDSALLKGEIDIAIHSAKDLPKNLHPELEIYALTKGIDDTDALVSHQPLKDLPIDAKIGTSSALRQSQILALKPNAQIVDIRGTIDERLDLLDKAKIHGIIVATCALKRLGLSSRITQIMPWEGSPLQGQLAIVGKSKNFELKQLFKSIDARLHYGHVHLAGAGPGDPELITLKAVNALRKAHCVLYDSLIEPTLLKFAPQAEHVYVGKRKGDHALSQQDICRLIKQKSYEGKNIVRLKGGDPLIFGRGGDEIEYLRSYHIPVDVIPGVSSATGIPSSLNIPLTARGFSSSVAFVSGYEHDEDHTQPRPIHIPQADTIVFLMGLTKLKQIIESLIAAKWPSSSLITLISKGTYYDQQVLQGNLSNIEALSQEAHLKPPVLIIAGEVGKFYKPTFKKTYLYLGTNPHIYQHLGRIIHWPMITIKPMEATASFQNDLSQSLKDSNWIILTSRFAVENFFQHASSLIPKEQLKQKKFAIIGQNTSEYVRLLGYEPSLIATEETAQGLYQALKEHMTLKGVKFLLPRSNLPNPFLKEALIKLGAEVAEITIYKNVKPAFRPLPDEPIDGIIFTSPSTLRYFLEDYGILSSSWEILAKGPVTAQALIEAGYKTYTIIE